jgi:hypothetical protein
MSENDVATADISAAATETVRPGEESEVEESKPSTPSQYWVRVHGYPGDLSTEAVYYNDFFDLGRGPLPGDPRENLRVGDFIVYYADGPASLYGVAVIAGPIQGPLPDDRGGSRWLVPIKREAIIRSVNKAPHAGGLRLPSGGHFLSFVRSYTFIRVPPEDGAYLVEQVKSRAGARE